jgi:2-polyprenyl-3-methyl-5-hydroxy-6-metoxy-1,4-benzoquinol methylase
LGFPRDPADDRLHATAHGQLEFERTRELLRRYLPSPPSRVLDIGGATGVHAGWLAEDGYRVHVVDLMPEHVAMAETPHRLAWVYAG